MIICERERPLQTVSLDFSPDDAAGMAVVDGTFPAPPDATSFSQLSPIFDLATRTVPMGFPNGAVESINHL